MKEVLSDLLQRSNVLRTPRLFFLTWWRLGTPSYPLVIFIPLGAAFTVKALSSLLFPHPNAHLQQEEWFIWIAICGKGIGISNFPLSLFESQVTCRELIPILWTVNHTGVGSPKMWESAGQDGGVRLCNSAHKPHPPVSALQLQRWCFGFPLIDSFVLFHYWCRTSREKDHYLLDPLGYTSTIMMMIMTLTIAIFLSYPVLNICCVKYCDEFKPTVLLNLPDTPMRQVLLLSLHHTWESWGVANNKHAHYHRSSKWWQRTWTSVDDSGPKHLPTMLLCLMVGENPFLDPIY